MMLLCSYQQLHRQQRLQCTHQQLHLFKMLLPPQHKMLLSSQAQQQPQDEVQQQQQQQKKQQQQQQQQRQQQQLQQRKPRRVCAGEDAAFVDNLPLETKVKNFLKCCLLLPARPRRLPLPLLVNNLQPLLQQQQLQQQQRHQAPTLPILLKEQQQQQHQHRDVLALVSRLLPPSPRRRMLQIQQNRKDSQRELQQTGSRSSSSSNSSSRVIQPHLQQPDTRQCGLRLRTGTPMLQELLLALPPQRQLQPQQHREGQKAVLRRQQKQQLELQQQQRERQNAVLHLGWRVLLQHLGAHEDIGLSEVYRLLRCCERFRETDPALLVLLLRRARCTDADAAAVRSLAGIIGCLSRMHILTPAAANAAVVDQSSGSAAGAYDAAAAAAAGAAAAASEIATGAVQSSELPAADCSRSSAVRLHAGGVEVMEAAAAAAPADFVATPAALAATVGPPQDANALLRQLPPQLCVSSFAAATVCSVAASRGCSAAEAGVQVYRQLQREAVLLVKQTAAALPLALLEGRAGGQEIGLVCEGLAAAGLRNSQMERYVLLWLCPSLSKALAVEGDPFAREFAPYIQQQRQKPLVRLNAQQLLSVLKWIAPTHAAARQQQQQPPERKTPVNAYASEELSAAQCANCAANGGSEDIQPLVWLSAWRQLLVGLMQFLPLLQIQQRLALLQTAAAADDDAAWRLSLVSVLETVATEGGEELSLQQQELLLAAIAASACAPSACPSSAAKQKLNAVSSICKALPRSLLLQRHRAAISAAATPSTATAAAAATVAAPAPAETLYGLLLHLPRAALGAAAETDAEAPPPTTGEDLTAAAGRSRKAYAREPAAAAPRAHRAEAAAALHEASRAFELISHEVLPTLKYVSGDQLLAAAEGLRGQLLLWAAQQHQQGRHIPLNHDAAHNGCWKLLLGLAAEGVRRAEHQVLPRRAEELLLLRCIEAANAWPVHLLSSPQQVQHLYESCRRILESLHRRLLGASVREGALAAAAAEAPAPAATTTTAACEATPATEHTHIASLASLARLALAAARLDAFRQGRCSILTEEQLPSRPQLPQLQQLQQQAAAKLLRCVRVLWNQQALPTSSLGAERLPLLVAPPARSEKQAQEELVRRCALQEQQQHLQQQLPDAAARVLRSSRSSAQCVRSLLRSFHAAQWPLNSQFAESVLKLLATRAAAAAAATAASSGTVASGDIMPGAKSGTLAAGEPTIVADLSLFASVLRQQLQGHAGADGMHGAPAQAAALPGTASSGLAGSFLSESSRLLQCMDGVFDLLSRLAAHQQQLHGWEYKQQQYDPHPAAAAAVAAQTAWGWLELDHLSALLRAAEWRLLHAAAMATAQTAGATATGASAAPERKAVPSGATGFQAATAATRLGRRPAASNAQDLQQDWVAGARRALETAWQLLLLEAAQPSKSSKHNSIAGPLPLRVYLDLEEAFHSYKAAQNHPHALLLPASFIAVAAAFAEDRSGGRCTPSAAASVLEADAVSWLLQRMRATAAAFAAPAEVQSGKPTVASLPERPLQQQQHALDMPASQSTFYFYRLLLRVADDGQRTPQQQHNTQEVKQQNPQVKQQPQQYQGRAKHWLSRTPLDFNLYPLLHHYVT